MFRGTFEHQLDPKGRLALPAAFRRSLAQAGEESLVITVHPDRKAPCLMAYPVKEWHAFETALGGKGQFDRKLVIVRRLVVGNAMECPLDRQGRVLVPPRLRDAVQLEREVVWVGAIRSIEIWSRSSWQAELEQMQDEVDDDVLRKLGELGI